MGIIKKNSFCFLRNIFFSFALFILLVDFSSALSIIPASVSIDFQPGVKKTIDYQISGVKQEVFYSLYVEGDLAEYVKLDRDKLKGGGTFKVNISLPNFIEKPGKHSIYIGVKEAYDDEVVGGTIGTAIEMKALVAVYVPYPGKYVEISSFISENVNVGEEIKFKFEVINRGKENVTIHPRIELFSNQSGDLVNTLSMEDRFLEPTQKISLYKALDTSSFNSGKYKGVLIIEYGGNYPSKEESLFKIGELEIEIKNYTGSFILDNKIQKFNIDIESGWNDKIDGVYADVSFLNGTSEVLFFKTSSASLNPWELKTITGYFDTSNFAEGFYDANITLFYYGKDVGKTSSKLVKVEFMKEPINLLIIVGISVGIILLITGVIFLIRKISKKNSKRK